MGTAQVSTLDMQAYLNVYKSALQTQIRYIQQKVLPDSFYKTLKANNIPLSAKLKVRDDVQRDKTLQLLHYSIIKLNDIYQRAADVAKSSITENSDPELFEQLCLIKKVQDEFQLHPKELKRCLDAIKVVKLPEETEGYFQHVTDEEIATFIRQKNGERISQPIKAADGPENDVEIVDDLREDGFITGDTVQSV